MKLELLLALVAVAAAAPIANGGDGILNGMFKYFYMYHRNIN